MYKYEWEDKCWGKVQHVFASEQAAISHLVVNRGWRCSKHLHRERANLFAVSSGCIAVDEWDKEKRIKTTFLEVGEVHVVPSGVMHRFRVVSSGVVIEVYWSDVDDGRVSLSDIDREDAGGQV